MWRLIDGIFYLEKNNAWIPVKAEDVFCSAFGNVTRENSLLDENTKPVRECFPEIKFSKFSVSPRIELELNNDEISIITYFVRGDKRFSIPLPTKDGIDYGFSTDTWHYFSGHYYEIAEVLEKSGIHKSVFSFKEYVTLINNLSMYPGISIIDDVKDKLLDAKRIEAEIQPSNLNAVLYPYQSIGYKWLKFITDDDCGCILGDEMGLGKTIQVISLMLYRQKIKQYPSLVVAPLSLLENWKREINKFAPEINVLVHHGSTRTGRFTDMLHYDVVITSYGSTISDLSLFEMITWDLLVLDEAQNIKNPAARRTDSIKQIPHRAGIAVTGTPFENHITDIWSLLDFCIPGCLGTLNSFHSEYSDNIYGAKKIEPILTALMLRRKVDEVAKDLPEKVVVPQPILMGDVEAKKYETIRQSILSSYDGKSASLAILTKLRMFCAHPALLDKSELYKDLTKTSSKYNRFCEITEEIIDSSEKVIVFTTFIEMSNIIVTDISKRFGIPVYSINGSTHPDDRQGIIDTFSNIIGSAMLVLNPRAAGTGLNITAANHVIHYNLEWNPALEDQATARSFRRGQDKTVFVYRLFYSNTVEEVVNEKIAKKREMSSVAVVGSEGTEDTRTLIINALGVSPVKEG